MQLNNNKRSLVLYIKNHFFQTILISYITTIVILYFLLPSESMRLIIDIIVTIIALLVPYISIKLERSRKEEAMREIYQICFNYITIICKCLINNELNERVFSYTRVLEGFKEKMIKLNIIYNERELRGTNKYIKIIINLLEQELEINLAIDINSALPVREEIYNFIRIKGIKITEKSKIKEMLDNFREKNDLIWKEEILIYFNS